MTTKAPTVEPDADPFAFLYRPLLRGGWHPADVDALEITDATYLFDPVDRVTGRPARAPFVQTPQFKAALDRFRADQAED